jgi:type I restriction enzyme S subunit
MVNHLGNWKNGELGDFVTLKRGFDLPQQKREDGQVPIFSSSGITGTHSTAMVKAPGVITGRYGTIGEVFYAAKDFWPLNTTLFVEDFHGNDAKFIYYFLKTLEWSKFTSASAVPGINRNTVHKEIVSLPDIETQRRIASTLSMFDEKIKINTEINDNLQQQAQAIYSSMFIDNPDPAWSHGHLSDLITVKYGKDHKKLADGIYPVYGSGGIMRYVERPLYNKESVLIPRKGTLNNVMYVNQPFWSVDTMFYTEMKLPNVAKFVYHFVKAKDLASMNAGSAVPSMTTDILNAMEVVIPSASALEEFESLVAPMYEAMEANDVQSKALPQMRDTLLPKLMSGEIDVSDIQL